MNDDTPAPPATADRVDIWETIDGRRQRFITCHPHGDTGLNIHVIGFQQADGSFDNVRVMVEEGEIPVDQVETVIAALTAAHAEAAALGHGD